MSDEPNGGRTSCLEIIGTKGFLFRESFGTTRTGENKPSNYRLILPNVARRRQLEGSLLNGANGAGMFSKITSFFSPIFSRSIQALCPMFSRHVSLRYLSESKRFLYREILPELPTCMREIHDGWRASGTNEPFLGSHYSLLGTKYSFVFRDNNESLLGAKHSFRGTKLVFRDNRESLLGAKLVFRDNSESHLGAKHSFRGTKIGFRDTNESILEAKHSF